MLNRRYIFDYGPLLLAGIILLISVAGAVSDSMGHNDGHFIYGLDDAYIHMSIARSFVEHGVWGMTEHGYTSTSSSPLWTLLLALTYFITGPNEIAPLALNIIAGGLVLLAADVVLRRFDVPALYRLVVLLALIVLLPLVTLILSGMEHTLQVATVIAFAGYAAHIAAVEDAPALASRQFGLLCLLGALAGTARYEGLFLVLIFCCFLALRLRIVQAVLLGAASIAPVIIYGLIAIRSGWEFLPTSLMVKSDAGYLSAAGPEAIFTYFVVDTFNIFSNQHVLSMLVVAALGICLYRYEKIRRVTDAPLLLLVAFVLISFVNVRLVAWPFAGTLARYEAYVIALGVVVLVAALGAYLPRRFELRTVPVYALALLLVFFVGRDVYDRYVFLTFENPIVTATRDIYQQQYQMARFLAEYYDDAVVAANDIGAINYFTRIDNIDLWGLGTIEVARARAENQYDTEAIRRITAERGGQIAIVYPDWFAPFGGLPDEWIEVGSWQLDRHPVILGADAVTFYAINPDEAESLAANLAAFMAELPAGVTASLNSDFVAVGR